MGIDPKIPPIELLSDDFMANVEGHAQGNAEAKASEMEHAIRKHCTIHFDEDPAFYKKLSDKLEKLIQRYGENWDVLAEQYELLREEALQGRTEAVEGLSREETTFYDFMAQLVFDDGHVPNELVEPMKKLIQQIVMLLKLTIDIKDFWAKPIEVRNLRGNIDTALLLANIPELLDKHDRIAVEIVKLAEKRHEELVK
jgi:type I restriction enzyme R subunit